MTNSPLVSVIVATYNRAALLKETINSILSQTYPNIELIIVSDASTDNTDEIVLSYNDKRITYLRLSKNAGLPSKTRNKGLEIATGAYIAFCDDDDLWVPHKLEKQMRVIHLNHSELCFTNRTYIDKYSNGVSRRNISIPTKATLSRLLLSNYVTLSSVLVKHDVMKRFEGFSTREEFRIGEDYELWARMLAEGVKFCSVNENLVLYRVHDHNVSKDLKAGTKGTIKVNRHLFQKYNLSKKIVIQTELVYFLKLVYHTLNGLKKRKHSLSYETS